MKQLTYLKAAKADYASNATVLCKKCKKYIGFTEAYVHGIIDTLPYGFIEDNICLECITQMFIEDVYEFHQFR